MAIVSGRKKYAKEWGLIQRNKPKYVDIDPAYDDMDAFIQTISCLGFTDIIQLVDPTHDEMDIAFNEMREKLYAMRSKDPETRFFVAFFFAGHGAIDYRGQVEILLDKDKRFQPSDRMR